MKATFPETRITLPSLNQKSVCRDSEVIAGDSFEGKIGETDGLAGGEVESEEGFELRHIFDILEVPIMTTRKQKAKNKRKQNQQNQEKGEQ